VDRRQFLKRAVVTGLGTAAVGWAFARRRSDTSEGADAVLTIYAAVDREVGEPVMAAYEAAVGRRVRAVYDSEAAKTVGLAKSIEIESAAPRADLWWSGESLYSAILAEKGFLAPIGDLAHRAAGGVDPSARFLPIARRLRVLCFRPAAIKEGDRPKTYADLADPRFAGRVAIAKASVGSTATQFYHWASDVKGRALLEKIAASRPLVVAGNSRAVLAVRNGQADLCVTDTDDVIVAREGDRSIDMVIPVAGEESGAALAIESSIGLVAGARNRAAAEAFVAWLLEDDAQAIIARSGGGAWPIRRKDIAPPGEAPLGDRAIEIPDVVMMAKRIDELKKIVAGIMGD
jgi:iron(III) transport system substrate-binding protein